MTIRLNMIDDRILVGISIQAFDFEYWSSLDSRYITLTIEAESRKEAVKEFRNMHPHKKFRLLDPLDE